MTEHSKKFTNKEDYGNAFRALTDYQKRHNILRLDFECLLQITEKSQNIKEDFNALYRACLRGILSLIESDIYGLNQIDKYPNYNDKHSFEDKFKNTLKQVGKTWNKHEIIQEYLDSRYIELKEIKRKRDKLIHPKKTTDIPIASDIEIKELKKVFTDYTKMLHEIMSNFFISIQVDDINEFIKMIKK